MPPILCKYTCDVDPDINSAHPELTQENFSSKISSVLGDERGWKKYGYEFEYKGRIPSKDKNTLHIVLVNGDKAKKMCGSKLGGFSCYSPDENFIYMNLTNWMGGSQSQLPLERYRTYVINHEVGHRLGFGHPDKQKTNYCSANKGKPGSVMIQMTRGPDWVAPCIENEWPLDPSIYDETKNPRIFNLYPVEGASEKFLPALAVAGGGIYALADKSDNSRIMVFIIVLVILLIWICSRSGSVYEGLEREITPKIVAWNNIIRGL
jgi:hypothetical protein